MSDPFVPRVGGVLSADIAVPDHEREVRFYSRVLGTGDTPLWREDLMNNLGIPIVGLGVSSKLSGAGVRSFRSSTCRKARSRLVSLAAMKALYSSSSPSKMTLISVGVIFISICCSP